MDQRPSEVSSSLTKTSKAKAPTKTKNRPQQSCNQCRERKVKCDRTKPCRACCIRGLECEYATNNEDRFQISQADVIEKLRKEVSRLKRDLADVEQSNQLQLVVPGGTDADVPQRKAQKRTADGSPSGSWAMLPDKGTTTSSMVVSETPHNAVAKTGQLMWSGAAALGTIAAPATSSMIQPPDSPYDGGWLNGGPAGGPSSYDPTSYMPFSDSIPNQPFISTERGNFLTNQSGHFRPEDWVSCPPAGYHGDSWKGKHELLQTILDTIYTCDDDRIGHIIDIVRNSTTPEDAFATIYQETMPMEPVLSVSGFSDPTTTTFPEDFSDLT